MAERVGFEPTVRCRTAVFKTASLNHSDISPCGHSRYAVSNAYLLYQICAVLSSPYANFSFFCNPYSSSLYFFIPFRFVSIISSIDFSVKKIVKKQGENFFQKKKKSACIL